MRVSANREDLTMLVHGTQTPRGCKRSMTRTAASAAVVLVATTVSMAARGEELRPIQAKSLQLGEINGVAYYTVQGQSYRVVATLASRDGTPVRFESTLSPGQRIVISTPGSAGANAQVVEFLRQGDRLLVQTNPAQTE
jgi:hypothetical protein